MQVAKELRGTGSQTNVCAGRETSQSIPVPLPAVHRILEGGIVEGCQISGVGEPPNSTAITIYAITLQNRKQASSFSKGFSDREKKQTNEQTKKPPHFNHHQGLVLFQPTRQTAGSQQGNSFSSFLNPYLLSKQAEKSRGHSLKPLKKTPRLLLKEELHSTFL